MAKLLQMPLLFGDAEPEVADRELAATPPQTLRLRPEMMAGPVPLDEDAPDAVARRQALDTQRSCIVEAPAGSGKTGLLIQRFLKLLADGGVDTPNQVLALTFTRKADAEMGQRVLGQLSAAAAGVPLASHAPPFAKATRELALAVLARDRALGWRLLEHPRQLNIRTIDSLCAELAGSLPLVAGAGGRYQPADDPQPFYDLAAERTLMHMNGQDPGLTRDLRELLLLRDARPSDFVFLLADMLKQRDQWGELLPLDATELTDDALNATIRPRLTRTLERLIGRELQTAANLMGPALLQHAAHLAHELSACPGYREAANPLAPCAELLEVPGTSVKDLPQWLCLSNLLLTTDDRGKWRTSFKRNHLGLDATADQQQELQYLVADAQHRTGQFPELPRVLANLRQLPSSPYPDEQWRFVRALCRVLRQALLELQIVFAERRQCDFTEISLNARQVFRHPAATPDLINTSVGQLQHLLVDEMQDTSAAQYELLEQLTETWDGVTQTIFLVGDPKQSIYEFRQARVERFLRVMQEGRFGQLPLRALRLTANFRSQAALVEEFNTTFCTLLPRPEELEQASGSVEVPFVAACPTRSAGTQPAVQWHVAERSAQKGNAAAFTAEPPEGATAAAQARRLREVVEAFLQRWSQEAGEHTVRLPRVAVLARNRGHLAPIVQEFHLDRGRGPIPFRAVDVEALSERPEILDLLALTRALLQPADRVAWLAVLRSPLCGLSLADLLAVTGEGPDADRQATVADLVETRRHLLSPAGQEWLLRSWPVLAQTVADLGRTSLRTHVERSWRTLGGDASLQEHQRSNAQQFLALLDDLETGSETLSLSLLNRRLRRLYAAPAAPGAPVELMTIHKAKGLEWDLVLIPALHRGSGRSTHEFLKWLEFDAADGSADLLLAPIQGKGDEPSRLSKWLARLQTAREAAEAKRLFYVACTRAREELHIFATVARRADGAMEAPQAASLLRAAWPVAEPIFAKQLAGRQTSAEVLAFPAPVDETTFTLAAASDALPATGGNGERSKSNVSALPHASRLPLGFDPASRFRPEDGAGLAYPAATNLRRHSSFARPEGSFAARAFGNVVHRFLPVLAERLADGSGADRLATDLSSWRTRLETALRGEGLAPAQARADAERAMGALRATLADPLGVWVLSPHRDARNEAPLQAVPDGGLPTLRADRTFFAGPAAGIASSPSSPADHLWIVDYKTAELGGRPRDSFLDEQRAKYLPQMEAYAARAVAAGHSLGQIRLALYFPLVPALVSWPANPLLAPA